MAAVITEVAYLDIAGSSHGRVKLTGTVTGSGSTSVVIQPGHNDVNVSGASGASTGLRTIDEGFVITKTNATANTFIAVKSFDATVGGDKITITCTSGDTFSWALEGSCAGA